MSSFSFNPEGYYLERKTKEQKLENNFYKTVSKIGELRMFMLTLRKILLWN